MTKSELEMFIAAFPKLSGTLQPIVLLLVLVVILQ